MKEDLKLSVVEFLEIFEEVFHNDWEYTKSMLGIEDESLEQSLNAKDLGLQTIDILSRDGTFLNPNIEDETENWGNRAKLLHKFRELKVRLTNSK